MHIAAGLDLRSRILRKGSRLADQNIETLVEDFEFLDDWEDRYRYVIELGRGLPPFPEGEKTDAWKVEGCVSQVWLKPSLEMQEGKSVLVFAGDSDAHIVRGLIAILLTLYSGNSPREILEQDAIAIFSRIGLDAHLTPQRSNGLQAMVQRIRNLASASAEAG